MSINLGQGRYAQILHALKNISFNPQYLVPTFAPAMRSTRAPSARLMPALLIPTLLISMLLSTNTFAAMEVDPDPVDMHYGQWPSAGDLDDNQAICVHAIKTVGPCLKKKCKAANYKVTASGTPDAGGLFRLYEVLGGINYIAYRVFYNAKAGIGGAKELTANVASKDQKKSSGQIPCKKDSGNIRVLIEEVAADGLAAASPGYYVGQLNSLFANQTTGETSNEAFNLSVSIGRWIRVSSLNDLTLTVGVPYNGLEAFCVFDNDISGAGYRLTATSANASAGLFRLHINVATVDYYTPYNVWFADNSAASAADTLLSSGASATPFVGSPLLDCGGIDNASVYVEANGFTQVGTYSDTLTIQIDPN